MTASPLLVLHIGAATVGLLSGAAAMSFHKGSRWHGLSGNVFFISMLCMSGAGAYMAFMKSQTNNVFGGVLTFYLVATAWRIDDISTWQVEMRKSGRRRKALVSKCACMRLESAIRTSIESDVTATDGFMKAELRIKRNRGAS